MKQRIKGLLKDEKAAALLIEYTLILPLVMGIVFVLIFTGYIQHQKSVLQAATNRGTEMACRVITDPNYKSITKADFNKDENDIESIDINKSSYSKHDPYRYLFRKDGVLPDVQTYVASIIKQNQIFLKNDPEVSVYEDAGLISKVTVTAKQDYNVPVVLPGLGLPKLVTIQSESMAYVNQPAEFIRNADFVIDLLQPVIDGVMDKIDDVVNKIKGVFEKVSFFKSNVK